MVVVTLEAGKQVRCDGDGCEKVTDPVGLFNGWLKVLMEDADKDKHFCPDCKSKLAEGGGC